MVAGRTCQADVWSCLSGINIHAILLFMFLYINYKYCIVLGRLGIEIPSTLCVCYYRWSNNPRHLVACWKTMMDIPLYNIIASCLCAHLLHGEDYKGEYIRDTCHSRLSYQSSSGCHSDHSLCSRDPGVKPGYLHFSSSSTMVNPVRIENAISGRVEIAVKAWV